MSINVDNSTNLYAQYLDHVGQTTESQDYKKMQLEMISLRKEFHKLVIKSNEILVQLFLFIKVYFYLFNLNTIENCPKKIHDSN